MAGLLAACGGPYSTLDPAGPAARTASLLWWGMFAAAVLLLALVVVLWLLALRREPGAQGEGHSRRVHRRWIIGGGLVLPLSGITLLLAAGIPAGHSMLPLPVTGEPPLRIEVTAHMWWWDVRYPESGLRLRDELHVPAGRPVDLELRSNDVIHSFWVPRLGGKLDMIPGRTNVLRLRADQPGVYLGQCAEFCGLGHAHMRFEVHAHEPEAFERWLSEAIEDGDD